MAQNLALANSIRVQAWMGLTVTINDQDGNINYRVEGMCLREDGSPVTIFANIVTPAGAARTTKTLPLADWLDHWPDNPPDLCAWSNLVGRMLAYARPRPLTGQGLKWR